LARKILLADDSVTAQNMGRKILADAGYEVITVNNGSAALKKISEVKPDLVILDVYMPGYSGLEVCQRLKESPDSSRIPVLLSVGKLEPFKPEEAQRVRAEAFIVKPFEASELLSALSKLEDKVVPRSEPSKPGRFARAFASAEESSRSQVQPVNGDEGGWKSRIGFPHEKKEAEEKAEADDASIYNPMNRDLRTVVATPAERVEERKQEPRNEEPTESSVDVAALAPAGMPQDVTPEEVAAIAAAAAQIQTLQAILKDELEEEQKSAQARASEPPSATSTPMAATVDIVAAGETAPAEARAAEENSQPAQNREAAEDDLPATMAAIAEIANSSDAPRWTAVSVALSADEASSLSLEQEMQKAYAAFVEQTASVEARNDEARPEAEPAPISPEPMAAAVPEPAIEAPPVAAGANAEAIQEPSPVGEIAQAVSQQRSQEQSAEPALPVAVPEEFPVASFAPAEPVASSEPEQYFPKPEAQFAAHVSEPVPEEAQAESTPPQFAEPVATTMADLPPAVEHNVEAVASALQELSSAPEPESIVSEAAPSSRAFTSFAPVPQQAEEHKQEESRKIESHGGESESVKTTAAAWASWRQIRDTNEPKPSASTATQAEADGQSSAQPQVVVEPTSDTAAMAVAAGAEQIAQEVAQAAAHNPADVASIVDSVLADLRPRLMAEISRKMSEKK
jgi:CheY-like chemotaxis protein